jgi:hypothetical protein
VGNSSRERGAPSTPWLYKLTVKGDAFARNIRREPKIAEFEGGHRKRPTRTLRGTRGFWASGEKRRRQQEATAHGTQSRW